MPTSPVLAVVTNAGLSDAIAAGNSGPQINITYFRIGSAAASDGAQALVTNTDVQNFVYQGTSSQMSYSVIDTDTVLYRIVLDQTIGNFEIGNVGIFTSDGTMFAQGVLPQETPKYFSQPPNLIGNRKVIDFVLVLSNQANIVNLNIFLANECSLPQVPTELLLPPATTAPFNTYLVLNHTHIGRPTLASRFNGFWNHTPLHLYPNEGVGVLATVPTQFDPLANVGNIVYYNPSTKTFQLADNVGLKVAFGLMISTYEIVTSGTVDLSITPIPSITTPMTIGTAFYCDTGGNAGKFTTTNNLSPIVAIAVGTFDLWINLAATNSTSALGLIPPSDLWHFGRDTGALNAMSIAPQLPLASYTDGVVVATIPLFSTTISNPTIAVSGLPPVVIIHGDSTALFPGDLQANTLYAFEYDNVLSRFRMLTQNPILASALDHYGVDTGTGNSMQVASVSPPIASVTTGMQFTIKKSATTNSAPLVCNIVGSLSSTSAAVTWADGTPFIGNEWPAGADGTFVFDGNYRMLALALATPIYLAAPRTYFVNVATGNDTNTGASSITAFATIPHALFVVSKLNLNGFNVTINIADGLYTYGSSVVLPPVNGSGSITIVGNIAAPNNCIISCTNGSTIFATGGIYNYTISGVKLQSLGTPAGDPGAGVFCTAVNCS